MADKIPDLPEGYKQRADNLIISIMRLAKPLWNIVTEFACDNIMLESEGFIVEVRGKTTEAHRKAIRDVGGDLYDMLEAHCPNAPCLEAWNKLTDSP